jgi:thioredoxin-related protein
MKYLYLILSFFCFTSCVQKDNKSNTLQEINWMSLEEAQNLNRESSRDVFIMVHANWCSKCERFQKETYTNPKVIESINTNFYPVLLNAHEPKDIKFKEKVYSNPNFDKEKGLEDMNSYHEILFELGAKSIPSIVFLDRNLNQVGSEMGFKEADELRSLIKLYLP